MTEHEQLMYQVLEKISELNATIVFKGALITKLILAENGYTTLDRKTIDIDANWIGSPPSMNALVDSINRSLGDMQDRFYAVAIREYGEKKSAGISIRRKGTDEDVIEMDISMKPVTGSRMYYHGETQIRGVLANEILADKITVLSNRIMFRRAKDLVDVYALTHCVSVVTAEIFEVITSKRLELGEFSELLNHRNEVEHAYNKLRGIDGKPAFDHVYSYLKEFVQPFAKRDETPRRWNSSAFIWEDFCQTKEQEGKPSVTAAIRAAEKERHSKTPSEPKKAKHKNEAEL